MEKSSKIFVAGHRGLVGSAIVRVLQNDGYTNIITRTHNELDLMDQQGVRNFFKHEQPEYVFLAAAFVGGILANSTERADFIYRNLAIQQNVIGESAIHGVKKLLFLGSSCIYPRLAPQPIPESALLSSPLEYTNEPYALAKIAGLKLCESFNIQYGTEFVAVMPTNLYGPNDNFDLERSHLLPAILRKMHLAKLLEDDNIEAIRNDLQVRPLTSFDAKNSSNSQIRSKLLSYGIAPNKLTLWGTGTPLRELMWSDDMAQACLHVMKHINFEDLKPSNPNDPITNCHINVGTGCEHSIAQIANLVKKEVGFMGKIAFDNNKPDGTPRKLLNVTKLTNLGWQYKTTLEQGIPLYYKWYLGTVN